MSAATTWPLGQVLTPTGPRFVAHAHAYHGFLVQRRYRRLPVPADPFRTAEAPAPVCYEPYLHPFWHPERVSAAGLSLPALEAWARDHPGQAFTHPTYRGLLLRWDHPAPGDAYRVSAYQLPAAVQEADDDWYVNVKARRPAERPPILFFTPTTDWVSGRTRYRLDHDVPAERSTLREAGLQWVPQGEDGAAPGWYTREWAAAQAAAQAARLEGCVAALRQHPLPAPTLLVYEGPGLVRSRQSFATIEQAWAVYQQVPRAAAECTREGAQLYPRLALAWERGAHAPAQLLADQAQPTGLVLHRGPDPTLPYLIPAFAFQRPGQPAAPAYAPSSDGQWVPVPDPALDPAPGLRAG
ncbi:hypothetical protein [Hymenobacter sublimis]|uniref:Uncharacterized protein n=1 Tax=Hymenobacter sublimis TaxID=2933777 RepID=A0ABY4JCJ1_9BACT|nr:hypothetical protein [Hymenobacter sublimis]UPL50191.1 hypothetical protein MWH26_04605 [Hymenobacter sublimis]